MTRFGFFFILLLSVLLLTVASLARVVAQVPPPPTPTPDPHIYSDAGMNYTAPPDAVLINRQEIPLAQLGDDLQPVALWVINQGKEDARTIGISMEAYTAEPSQWEGQFESQTHGAQEGTLIRNKTPMSLLNGMPATFVEVAYGSGFDAKKEYAVVWADGQRGIVLAETTRMGDGSDEEALRVLKQVTAVAYPLYQP
jgi:opacity protein-like surface antigen